MPPTIFYSWWNVQLTGQAHSNLTRLHVIGVFIPCCRYRSLSSMLCPASPRVSSIDGLGLLGWRRKRKIPLGSSKNSESLKQNHVFVTVECVHGQSYVWIGAWVLHKWHVAHGRVYFLPSEHSYQHWTNGCLRLRCAAMFFVCTNGITIDCAAVFALHSIGTYNICGLDTHEASPKGNMNLVVLECAVITGHRWMVANGQPITMTWWCARLLAANAEKMRAENIR